MAGKIRTHSSAPADKTERELMRAAMNAPLLERDKELDLARRWRNQRDEAALHELTQSYLRLVMSIAGRYRNYGLPFGDLMQEGTIGLMEAASRFEPERENRFSTYASWWIRAAIQDFVLRNWSIVRTGTTAAHKTLFFNLRRLRAMIGRSDGPLTRAERLEIARKLGVGEPDVALMEARLTGGDRSLNQTLGSDGDSETNWQDLLADSRPLQDESLAESRDAATAQALLQQALAELTEREREVIRERRLRENGATLAILGDRLGVSKERVRQIEGKALEKLRQSLLRLIGGDPVAAGLV